MRVFRSLKSFRAGEGSFGVWLTRLTRNLLIDHYRRTKKDRVTSSLEDDAGVMVERPDSGPAPSGRVESREQREWLQAGLNQLSPDLREAVILRDLSDLDYEEIAAVLGVPQGTVKSRINRGRLELARVLKRMEGMEGQK